MEKKISWSWLRCVNILCHYQMFKSLFIRKAFCDIWNWLGGRWRGIDSARLYRWTGVSTKEVGWYRCTRINNPWQKSVNQNQSIVNCCKITCSFRTILYVHHAGIMTEKLSGKCTLIISWNLTVFLFLKLLSNLIFEEDYIFIWEQKSDFSIFSVRILGFNHFIYTVWILVDHSTEGTHYNHLW